MDESYELRTQHLLRSDSQPVNALDNTTGVEHPYSPHQNPQGHSYPGFPHPPMAWREPPVVRFASDRPPTHRSWSVPPSHWTGNPADALPAQHPSSGPPAGPSSYPLSTRHPWSRPLAGPSSFPLSKQQAGYFSEPLAAPSFDHRTGNPTVGPFSEPLPGQYLSNGPPAGPSSYPLSTRHPYGRPPAGPSSFPLSTQQAGYLNENETPAAPSSFVAVNPWGRSRRSWGRSRPQTNPPYLPATSGSILTPHGLPIQPFYPPAASSASSASSEDGRYFLSPRLYSTRPADFEYAGSPPSEERLSSEHLPKPDLPGPLFGARPRPAISPAVASDVSSETAPFVAVPTHPLFGQSETNMSTPLGFVPFAPPPGFVPQIFVPNASIPNASGFASGLPIPVTTTTKSRWHLYVQDAILVAYTFLLEQLYLHFLLRMPFLYFSRVARVFEDAQFSLPEIKRMALDEWNSNEKQKTKKAHMFFVQQDSAVLPPSLLNFRTSWENFIDSLMREWKTLNIISVLLLSAILTMLQIDAASHPITRTSALCSLICALMSLLYGCMYIIRFGTMRKLYKASSFASEAQKDTPSIWWNVWVLLAMPATWLAWSIVMFLTCIMSFIWLSGTDQNLDDFTVSPHVTLGLRIGLTTVFSFGLIYFVLIVKTFRRYGDALDKEFMRTVTVWAKEEAIRGYQPVLPPLQSGENHPFIPPRMFSPWIASHPGPWPGPPPLGAWTGLPWGPPWMESRPGPTNSPPVVPCSVSSGSSRSSSPIVFSSNPSYGADNFSEQPLPPPQVVRLRNEDDMDNTPVPPTTDSEQPGQRLELESPLSSTSTQVVSQVDPFQVGPHYGPVLDPLQIHVLGVTLRLNPLLQHPTAPGARPRLEWNLLFPSGQCSRSDDPPLSWWNGRHEPATFPRSTCIHLVSEVLPWVISVAARNLDVGVTCGDLIDYIAHDMNQFVKQAEYERLPRIQREELRRAYRYNRSRADGVPGELLAPAMRRLDWLGRYTTFAGVRENVALGKRICGDALPCTFELVCLPTTHPIQDDGIRDQDGQDDSACATASRSLCEEEKIDRDFETLEERGGEEKEEKQQPLETIVEGHIEETGDGEA